MLFAEQFEIVTNVHVTGFTYMTRHDGVECVEIHFEENEDAPSMEQSTELEYINDDDNWPDEYIDYPDWDEDE